MAYYIDLFSVDTIEAFTNSKENISGFRERQRGIAQDVKPGDKLICYVTRLSRWFGILEVTSNYFIDNKPIFYPTNDPFVVRFKVKPTVWLPLEEAMPIFDSSIWSQLSFTKNLKRGDMHWTRMVRGSLKKLDDKDGEFLERMLLKQSKSPKPFPITEDDRKKLKTPKVKTADRKEVVVSIPANETAGKNGTPASSIRESTKVQAQLAKIGERMNLKIWLPRNDRARVTELWKPQANTLLQDLPLQYDNVTLGTIENIDVLWVRGRSIVRAFEVEHTTSIYSGILRMADLMALQPNLDIKAHIVAPLDRKDKVFEEITRPVFTLLDRKPLSESCSFISYDAVNDLSKEKRLEYMNDTVLDEYSEYAEETEL